MPHEKAPALRSLIFRLMLSAGLALTGLGGLLITRLQNPLVLEFLRPWREPAFWPSPGLEGQPVWGWAPMRNQFEIDLVSATLAGLGLFLIIYYRCRLSPILDKLEEMRLDRW